MSATLGGVCSFLNGGTPSRSVARYFEGDIPWITGADIDGPIVNKARSFITDEAISNSATNLVPAGTILLVTRTSVGKVAIAGTPLCFSQDITAITPDPEEVDAGYLAHLLRTKQPHFERLARGATIKGVTREAVSDIRVPLPPLLEQRRIAEILDKADALRAKRRAALAQLDTLTQSIFLDMFGDPATNPKGWPKMPFGEVCETRLGKMLDRKQQTGKNRRPYLRNANVQWFRFDLNDVLLMDFDEDDRRILRLKSGDLLICEGGEPGRAAVWRGEMEECYFQKALHRARPNARLASSPYLAWLLWFLAQRSLLSGVTSATIAHLTGEKLAVLDAVLPPIDLQLEFTRRVEGLDAIRRTFRAAEAGFGRVFAALQYAAFRGDL